MLKKTICLENQYRNKVYPKGLAVVPPLDEVKMRRAVEKYGSVKYFLVFLAICRFSNYIMNRIESNHRHLQRLHGRGQLCWDERIHTLLEGRVHEFTRWQDTTRNGCCRLRHRERHRHVDSAQQLVGKMGRQGFWVALTTKYWFDLLVLNTYLMISISLKFQGYILMKRGSNTCGIAEMVVCPII